MQMKKRTTWIVSLLLLVLAIGFLTPLGEMCVGTAHFIFLCVDYGRKERAAEKQIAGFSEKDNVALVNAVALLTSQYEPPENTEAALEMEPHKGARIPDSLVYLKPQRVWITRDSVRIELLHMMDADTTLFVKRGEDSLWTITGHFGDYMNKERFLWKEPEGK
jgi:hypothetical protein